MPREIKIFKKFTELLPDEGKQIIVKKGEEYLLAVAWSGYYYLIDIIYSSGDRVEVFYSCCGDKEWCYFSDFVKLNILKG